MDTKGSYTRLRQLKHRPHTGCWEFAGGLGRADWETAAEARTDTAPWEQPKADGLEQSDIESALDELIAGEEDLTQLTGSELAKERAKLLVRINKAAEFGSAPEGLVNITSLISGPVLCSITRKGDKLLSRRALQRTRIPELEPRIMDQYELSAFAIEQGRRKEEEEEGVPVEYYVHHLENALSWGHTKRFRLFTLNLGLFKIGHISTLAANDWLRNPTLMMASYLELSAAVESLALSGQLSKSASVKAQSFAEALELAPVACLDYLDAMYRSQDPDGEFFGFSIVGHLLQNETVDKGTTEWAQLPFMMTQPLAVMEVALKHDRKRFFSQRIVYTTMRNEWTGGGYSEDYLHFYQR
jgi:hypothetical protein